MLEVKVKNGEIFKMTGKKKVKIPGVAVVISYKEESFEVQVDYYPNRERKNVDEKEKEKEYKKTIQRIKKKAPKQADAFCRTGSSYEFIPKDGGNALSESRHFYALNITYLKILKDLSLQ